MRPQFCLTYIPINKQGPNLQSPPKAVEAISYAGFNVAKLVYEPY